MTTIKIRGPIVDADEAWIYDWFGMQHTTAEKVEKELNEASGKVTVIINSPGGSVYEANEIYHMLKKYSETNELSVEIAGIAASAASYIATAAKDVAISPLAQIMVHNASAVSRGDYRDMQHTSDVLQKVNKSIVNAYMLKTGLKEEELLQMMNNETYMGAQEAVDKGFANRVLFDDGAVKFAASALTSEFLPRGVIEKMQKDAITIKERKGNVAKTGGIDKNTKNVTEDDGNIAKKHENNSDDRKSPVASEGEGGKEMTYEELKNNHPELFNQIKNEGFKAGVQEENARIKSIDSLSSTGMEELLNKAKYEESMDAGQLAIEILNKQAEIGKNHTKNVEEDAMALENVKNKATDDEENKKAQEAIKNVAGLENIFKSGGVL
ncbi:hypothetical protein GCM10007425_29450 [Lysinibacillus alkalisoli]|uniref:ATP-dependent Clp protease proteolytic subunit n=1 Tax=Lysinibacillus alkalisoli TaxID=1911548 RepID=A0A917GA43_9BACI|nr:head maturation protease, ClpP-related [Lysinibacillus alkalisoli]GGG32890.1 hypothetical protein GCM10007425_29450 [Lysinibacillus alkalisoli]